MIATPHRIVLVLQAAPVSEAAFAPVLRIARRTAARVEGVFVEDSRLLDVAALPSGRFIHAYSRETTALDERVIRRALRVTSGRVRQAFAARISDAAISGGVSARACASLTEAFGEATAGDLIVVPLRRNGSNIGQVTELVRAITQRIAASLLVLNERGAPSSSILVLFDGDLDDLAAALDLADLLDCRARILAVAPSDEKSATLAETARRHLARLQRPAPVETLSYRDGAELDRAVRAAAPATLVLDRTGETARSLDLADLLATSNMSLYLRN